MAYLANAARCGGSHCYVTGPFLLLIALATPLRGFDVVSLGAQGGLWLGATLVLGTALIWILTEYVWGAYAGRSG